MSLSRKIALGLAAGVAVGLFLGERAAFLEWPAKAFVQLLQVTVMPYLGTSLVSGIASRSSAQARRLFTRAGVVVLALWALSLALVFAVPAALRRGRTARERSPLVDRPGCVRVVEALKARGRGPLSTLPAG